MTDEFRNNANKGRSRGPKPDQGKRRCRLGRPGDAETGDRTLCRNAPVGLCALGFDHQRFSAVNDDLLEYLGYTREEFLQLDPAELVAPADQRHFNRRLAEIRNGRREVLRIALQLRCKDARDLKSLVAIRGAPESGCIRIAAMALLDLDAPRERNPVLGRSEQHFHTLVETMAEGLALMDAGGRIVYVNRRLVHMSGYRTEELVGRNVRDFVAAQALAPFEDILAGRCGGPRQPFEIAWAAKDGRRNFSRLSPQPLFDEGGRFCGALIVVTDITAQKIAERTLREREEELQRKNDHLEEINTALQTLVKIREIDKTELEETVVANIHQLADPLLVRLKASGLNERQLQVAGRDLLRKRCANLVQIGF